MRYRRIETVAYLLALALVGLAVAVAALRSRPAEPGPALAPPPPSPAAATEPARGAELYRAECAACHRPSRPIDGADRYTEPDARAALIDLLLAGAIDGEPGAHPDAGHLGDADVAALAGHFLELWSGGDGPAVTPDQVAARRRC